MEALFAFYAINDLVLWQEWRVLHADTGLALCLRKDTEMKMS